MLPIPPDKKYLNPTAQLPYGVQPDHVFKAMCDFADFLTTVNQSLIAKDMPRLESICMPANFSSIVGEFCTSAIPKHYSGIAKNNYHNGHPDLVPAGVFEDNAVQHSDKGIEVKASRYHKSWQGHNAEEIFLMVFVFISDRPKKVEKKPLRKKIVVGANEAIPFQFLGCYGANLLKSDWKFAGRKEGSRRTITASVLDSGYDKMIKNWIYSVNPLASPALQAAELELEQQAEE